MSTLFSRHSHRESDKAVSFWPRSLFAGRLLFPFANSDWSIKYDHEQPVQPKLDLNAPDLYLPSMAYVTYVLIVGYILGLRNAFSPDLLATTASSALVWLVLEIGEHFFSH